MSAKWRALQHRHRYTYSALTFPQHFLSAVHSLLPHAPCSHFHSTLLHLTTLSSTFSQLTHSNNLASSFCNLLLLLPPTDPQSHPPLLEASRTYLHLLFLENSAPLHRTLLSPLVKAGPWTTLIAQCFRKLCQDYAASDAGGGCRFAVSRAALSVMGMTKLGYLVDVVDECAVIVACDVVSGLNSVVLEIQGLRGRPSPIVMEQCQEGLSCLYYLLQKFPLRFREFGADGDGNFDCDCEGGGGGVMRGIVTVLLSVLSSSAALSLDCFVAAGVALSRNLLNTQFTVLDGCEVENVGGRTIIKAILYDGILPELFKYCENPVDSHFNFHALTVMQICLQQIKTSILSNLTDLSGNYDPIPEEMGLRILRIIWNNLEDPLSQTQNVLLLLKIMGNEKKRKILYTNKPKSLKEAFKIWMLKLFMGRQHCKICRNYRIRYVSTKTGRRSSWFVEQQQQNAAVAKDKVS